MSDLARKLFEGLQSAKETTLKIFPGLENVGPELKSEGSRLWTQGTMELASALFNGHSFVPYGPGQYTPSPAEHQQDHAHESHEINMERER